MVTETFTHQRCIHCGNSTATRECYEWMAPTGVASVYIERVKAAQGFTDALIRRCIVTCKPCNKVDDIPEIKFL